MTQIGQWQRKKVRRLADCRVFTVSESTSISPLSGEEHLFYFIDSADWVNIVPITPERQVVFVKQFRHGSEQITLEIPGGMIDPGEAPEVAATRECLEESGYKADRVESLGVLNPNPAVFPNRLHTFVARECIRVDEIANTSTEQTEVVLVPLEELPEMLGSGQIDHALVAATLWRLLYQEKP